MERSKVDKPVVIFTVGTMPNSRHAMRDLCLAWYLILFESVEAVRGEELEEEKRSEESERQTGQETDVAEESEKEEPCEESESQSGQETGAAIVDC